MSSTRTTTAGTSRRGFLLGGAAGLVGAATLGAPAAHAAPALLTGRGGRFDTATVRRWAGDTWHSLVAMTDETTGLVADNSPESLAPGDRSGYTSPTNIGGYLWSALVARELGLLSKQECSRRLVQTLTTLQRMQHHTPSGMYYNWYDEATGDVVTTWPDSGDRVYPFLSSVDNGWLGAALAVVRSADRAAAPLADQLFRAMRWDMFLNPERGPAGLLHGGFYDAPPPEGADVFTGNHIGIGPDVWYTNHHYDTIVSETRVTTYLGIVTGQIPASQYFSAWRTFPDGCDWAWPESRPVGRTRSYLGVDVFEGAYEYRGTRVVPGWGGSMFEELMPDVFVPEASWGKRSWGQNHPLHVRAQREHGLDEAGYGFWGFSPSSDPLGGYREYGVDALGMNPDGYFSDVEKTNYDPGFDGCRDATNPTPTYGDGVVTPHASFLAMMHEPREAFANLVGIERDLGAYGTGGFFDAVAVGSGTVARRYLSLDQAMVMGAVGNVLHRDLLRNAFCTKEATRRLRPVLAMEQFGAGVD